MAVPSSRKSDNCSDEPTGDICIPPAKLFSELDNYMEVQFDDRTDEASTTAGRRQDWNGQTDESLRRAMHSYAVQWLPVLEQRNPTTMIPVEHIIRNSWRATRRDMLRVMNRKSYRSVLTLYLFSQTPVPAGLSEEEEQDGISGLVCVQTALVQIQQLRERLRSCQFDGSEVLAWPDSVSSPSPTRNLSEAFLNLESRAYWAAVTWDTSCSMTLNFRSSLSSGLKGACLETSWRLARGFLVGSFQPRTEEWRKKGFEVSDDIAQEIMSAVAVCRIYTWRTIASVKEALREGVEEDSVLFSWKALLDALGIFKTTIHPLLDSCEKQLHFLSQVTRLYWYEMVLHYYLGILMLVDALEFGQRSDLLSQITEMRLEAEHGCFNVLKFGVESKYVVNGSQSDAKDASDQISTTLPSEHPIVTSFVAVDPYPHHVVASVRLVNKVISRKYRQGNTKYEAYSHLSSTLLKTLAELPPSSKAVLSARQNLQESIDHLETGSVTDVSCAD
ncbi:uncharacterized protein A1O9_10459 [Exophiala aquamarina CBS 119918]|uniref:Transcription factor domain-containing protein n=1 Tax=Exophiala aquamarina CBS 119918 TaxID=1182545 RepID=A0A072P039_9EURO|nr:uncharacterized protein A1O9_10459 [Exophiala aquamarina CBS 119918]KEF53484.1 hypothetical protein A1O9_10459 [Exophiala aquamarina CBS 119918]